MKRAIIVGCNGQDGTLLYEYLSNKNYLILGLGRDSNKSNESGWDKPIDISNSTEIFDTIKKFKPNEIYHLAAYHHSSQDIMPDDIELYELSYNTNVLSLVNFLEGINRFSKDTRLFYAASSLIFGQASEEYQDENTKMNPACIYGLTKSFGVLACRYFRNKHSLFVSTGILYNHESKYRNPKFLSKKVITTLINIKNKKQDKLIVGDLEAEVDWGYAPDYVDAMYKILNLASPDEFIIASGEKHTVKEFIEEAFSNLSLDWKQYVEEEKDIIKRKKAVLVGNNTKLKQLTAKE